MTKLITTIMRLHALDDGQDWLQLTPQGEFSAIDGRGPFIADEKAILSAAQGKKLPIDINHAIDKKGSKGEPSPAVGWIDELQARDDGIWGHVVWTEAGKNILNNKEYGAISPVLIAGNTKPHRVYEIARAALVNDPGLPQLKSLFNQNGENAMIEELRAALSLTESATERDMIEAVTAAVKKAHEFKRLQKTVGLEDSDKLISTFQASVHEKTDLEQKLTEVNQQLMAFRQERAREKAESFVAQAIDNFKIVPSLKEHFIARYIREPEVVETEINATPALFVKKTECGLKTAKTELDDNAKQIVALMGLDPKKFAETQSKLKETL